MPMQISDADIEWTERLLLPDGCHFNDERRAFIRCLESRDVVACPGSGKTTALLAKLLILATRLPLPDGRGVCVLTHTNVAIDQIKGRAGSAAEVLFRHPSFFGTIQEFANRFLALPAYVARFGSRHVRMDEDLYGELARRAFLADSTLEKNGAIFGQIKERVKGLNWREQRAVKIEFFASLRFRFRDDAVDYVRGDTEKTFLRGDGGSDSYAAIHAAKHGLLEEGYLRYQDAFPLAVWYLRTNPALSDAFRARFAFVFVDEAQDTNADQLELLAGTFPDRKKTVVQYLGDPNQAIYSFDVRADMAWGPGPRPLHFSDTVRYGQSIAHVLDTVRVDRQISLIPNARRDSLPPHLLCFASGQEEQVLTVFAQLIRKHRLHEVDGSDGPVFKAVGWVGKDKKDEGKLCLRYYMDTYCRALQRRRQHFSNLISHLHRPSRCDPEADGARVFRDAILRGMTRGLAIGGIRHPVSGRTFTPQALLDCMREEDEAYYAGFLKTMSSWVLASRRGRLTADDLRGQIADLLRAKWKLDPSDELDEYLNSGDLDVKQEEQETNNIFRDGDIEIEVGTVHSVKGETHTATLYLETFNHDLDSTRLLPFLKGKYPEKESSKPRHIENLKIAHVAFSRPTHLLAFACCRSTIEGHEQDLGANGWEILNVVAPAS